MAVPYVNYSLLKEMISNRVPYEQAIRCIYSKTNTDKSNIIQGGLPLKDWNTNSTKPSVQSAEQVHKV